MAMGNPTGQLPKLHFPKFNGENPKLWISRCEDYFQMYSLDSSLWIMVSSMHFSDAAARWLQSVDRQVKKLDWKEFCKLLLQRFGHDQHELLIRQMLNIRQVSTVADYIERFTALVDQLRAYESSTDPLYQTMRFIHGLRDDIKSAIVIQRPVDLDAACVLAQLQEDVTPACTKRDSRVQEYSPSTKFLQKSALPLLVPPSRWDKQAHSIPADNKKPSDQSKQQSVEDKLGALKAYRRARGLCEKCSEKWNRGHRCGTQVQLHVLDEL